MSGWRRRQVPDPAAFRWAGPHRRYDLVKEFAIALAVVSLLTLLLAGIFSSPDEPQVTITQWAKAAPADS